MTILYKVNNSKVSNKGSEKNIVFKENKALINGEWKNMTRSKYLQYCKKNNIKVVIK